MNKLNKPKAFEASESILVQFGTEQVEVANLLKSGIKNQSVVLVAHGGKWHEIEITDLGLDSSHLPSFQNHIETNKLTLSDLGVTEENNVNYGLGHADFLYLQDKFPLFNYVDIAKLNDYNISKGKKGSIDVLKDDLAYFTRDGISIDDYIKPKYEDVVNTDKPQQSIVVEVIPTPPTPPTDSVSLQIFEKLTPEKITELQGLRITQEEIVKANPVVIIKDKKTYAEAKKVAAILLSASTAIDCPKKGTEATAVRYLNTFKTMLKTALAPIAKMTREPYDKQKKLIDDWDNRLIKQAQDRKKELQTIPFTYNSESDSYSVGSLIITQKDIEEKTDADFTSLVAQGKAIIIALESVKSEQDSKIAEQEKQIAELKAKLDLLLKANNPDSNITHHDDGSVSMKITSDFDGIKSINLSTNTMLIGHTCIPVLSPFETSEETQVDEITNENPFAPVSTQSIVYHQNSVRDEEKEEKQYSLPNPNNKLLNELDLAHISILEESKYIECREYYKQGLSDAADAINDILVNPDKAVQKSVAITELIKTWKL